MEPAVGVHTKEYEFALWVRMNRSILLSKFGGVRPAEPRGSRWVTNAATRVS